jgi:hypothetical protein
LLGFTLDIATFGIYASGEALSMVDDLGEARKRTMVPRSPIDIV